MEFLLNTALELQIDIDSNRHWLDNSHSATVISGKSHSSHLQGIMSDFIYRMLKPWEGVSAKNPVNMQIYANFIKPEQTAENRVGMDA